MEIQLDESLFVNNVYSIRYGEDKEAMFTIVDEEFPGNGRIGKIDGITVLTRTYDAQGRVSPATLRFGVIGIGDGVVGVTSSNAALRGTLLKRSNMTEVTVILYE
jgi:hypothetical protein